MKLQILRLGWRLIFLLPLASVGQEIGLSRHVEQTAANINTPIQVTLNFTNRSSLPVRGFYCGEQLPAGLALTPVSITVHGISQTQASRETGWPDDVLLGLTPERWILEQPPNLLENQPLPAGATGQIIYTLTATAPGSYALSAPDWVGRTTNTNVVFGFGTPAATQWLTFVGTNWPAALQLQLTNGSAQLIFPTESGVNYIVEFCPEGNDANWTALTTVSGTGQSVAVDVGNATQPGCFYRVRLP